MDTGIVVIKQTTDLTVPLFFQTNHQKKFTGWEARIFQHEYDHLQGTVYIDRLTEEGRETVQPRLNELIQEFGEGGAL